jgi:DNA-binding Lrp family transcriptional regulator
LTLQQPASLLAVRKDIDPSGEISLPNEVIVILNLFVESIELEKVTNSLVKLTEITDVYEVTGEYDIVCLLRTESILAFREVLKNKILRIPGVKSTVSAIVLYTHKRDRKAVSE